MWPRRNICIHFLKKLYLFSSLQAKYLSNLIERYKEWSWQLYPSFEYTEVLSRTYALSKDAAMRNLVEQLRKEECARRMVFIHLFTSYFSFVYLLFFSFLWR